MAAQGSTIGRVTNEPGDSLEPARLRASNADREQVARTLNTAMADGRLTPAELAERLDQVYGARTLGELEPLTRDLPDHRPLVPPVASSGPWSPGPHPTGTSLPAYRIGGAPTSNVAIGVMSGAERKGPWGVPAQFSAVAFWGGVELDLTQARFTTPTVTITAVAIMGGVEIVVPDDITVIVNGVGIMGAFEDKAQVQGPPGAPVVRVNGMAFWGGVEVKRGRPRMIGGGRVSLEK